MSNQRYQIDSLIELENQVKIDFRRETSEDFEGRTELLLVRKSNLIEFTNKIRGNGLCSESKKIGMLEAFFSFRFYFQALSE